MLWVHRARETEMYDHAKATQDAMALDAKLAPSFQAFLAGLKVSELKTLARTERANTRGCAVRADWVRAVEQIWRRQVWDEAGYRYGGHRDLSRTLITKGN